MDPLRYDPTKHSITNQSSDQVVISGFDEKDQLIIRTTKRQKIENLDDNSSTADAMDTMDTYDTMNR